MADEVLHATVDEVRAEARSVIRELGVVAIAVNETDERIDFTPPPDGDSTVNNETRSN